MRPATAIFVIWTMLTVGCASKTPASALPSIATDGCPAVLLTRDGGLGFELQGGVLVAVWPTGTIVRAEAQALPARYLIGRLNQADTAALRELAESAKTWEQPLGKAVLNTADTLTLRRGQEVRQWFESPGFTGTPTVNEFRSRLFSLPIEKAQRFNESLKDVYQCAKVAAPR